MVLSPVECIRSYYVEAVWDYSHVVCLLIVNLLKTVVDLAEGFIDSGYLPCTQCIWNDVDRFRTGRHHGSTDQIISSLPEGITCQSSP